MPITRELLADSLSLSLSLTQCSFGLVSSFHPGSNHSGGALEVSYRPWQAGKPAGLPRAFCANTGEWFVRRAARNGCQFNDDNKNPQRNNSGGTTIADRIAIALFGKFLCDSNKSCHAFVLRGRRGNVRLYKLVKRQCQICNPR